MTVELKYIGEIHGWKQYRYEPTGIKTETPHPSHRKGADLQDGSGKDEVEKRSGKGEDNEGGECL